MHIGVRVCVWGEFQLNRLTEKKHNSLKCFKTVEGWGNVGGKEQ